MKLRKKIRNSLIMSLVFCLIFSSVPAFAYSSMKTPMDSKSSIEKEIEKIQKAKRAKKNEVEYIESSRTIKNSEAKLPFIIASKVINNEEVTTNLKLDKDFTKKDSIRISITDDKKSDVFNDDVNGSSKNIRLKNIEPETEYNIEIVTKSKEKNGEMSYFYKGKYTLKIEKDKHSNIVSVEDDLKDVYFNEGFKSPELEMAVERISEIQMKMLQEKPDLDKTSKTDSSAEIDEVEKEAIDISEKLSDYGVKSVSLRSTGSFDRYENESNDSFSRADRFYDDDTVGGKIQSSGDEDYYKVKFSRDGAANFWLGFVPDDEDYELYVYDDNYDRIAKSTSGGNGDQELIEMHPVEGGRYYYVKVEGYRDDDYDSSHYYHLRAKWYEGESPNEGDEYEPNDTFDDATRLSGDTNRIYATLHNEDDDDFYRIVLSDKSKLTIDLESIPSGENYKLKLYNSDRDRIGYSNNSGNDDEQIIQTVDSGIYYIKIYPNGDSYDSDDTYRLEINIEDASEEQPDKYEPNNSIDDATRLSGNSNDIYATIHNEDDEDYYRIHLDEESNVTIDLTSIPTNQDYDLSLKDSHGDTVAYSHNSSDTNEHINKELPSGTYCIKIFACDSFDAQDTYKLSVDIEEAAVEEEIVYKMTYEGKDIYIYGLDGNDPDDMYAIVADENDSEGEKWVYSEIAGWDDTSLYASVPTDGGVAVAVAASGKLDNASLESRSVKKIVKIVEIRLDKLKDKLKSAMINYIGINFAELSSEEQKMLVGGLVSSADDNISFGLFKKVSGTVDYDENYYFMRSKAFGDACFVAAYATATLGSAAEAARALANSGVAGGFALATGGATGAVAVEELARSVAFAGVSFASNKMMNRSKNILSSSSGKLNRMSKLKPGDKTPNGHVLTKHAADNANARGFSLKNIDDVINNTSKKYYSYGEEIFTRKNNNWYEVVIKARDNKNIVSVIGGKTHSMKTIKDVERFLKNSGRSISTIPF